MATATDLSSRVNDISNRMNDVSDRLSKFEGASSFLATKEDIALVKGDIEKSINSLLWKLLGALISVGLLVFAALRYLP